MHAKLKATPGIYLVGFMGCGKTTVGQRLAARLQWDFVDLDDEIERKSGMKIANVFEQLGEPAFRAMSGRHFWSRFLLCAAAGPVSLPWEEELSSRPATAKLSSKPESRSGSMPPSISYGREWRMKTRGPWHGIARPSRGFSSSAVPDTRKQTSRFRRVPMDRRRLSTRFSGSRSSDAGPCLLLNALYGL